MQGNRPRDTAPEVRVRRLVHAMGLRYRVNARPSADLPRTADLMFSGARVAVFIDGCFWHGCPEHYTAPASNSEFWRGKVERNRARDSDTTRRLSDEGWRVMRFWTHEDPLGVAETIREAVLSGPRPAPRAA